jgi:SM-20-related protein
MAVHETIETLSGALMSDERILNVAEKELLANLIQRANQNPNPQDQNVTDAIARIVGEIVAERAYKVMGSSIAQQLLKQWTRPVDGRTTNRMNLGSPGLPPGPSPDNAPRPPGPTPPNAMRLGSPGLPPGPSPDNAPRPPGPTPPNRTRETETVSSGVAVAEQSSVMPAQCLLLDEFLAPEELHDLMQETLAREMEFQISEVIAPGLPGGITDFEHRRSHVLMNLGKHREILLDRLQSCLPSVLRKLGRDPFRASHVELQITASNDGDFFHWHCDNAEERIASRELTFVYFFHREPKNFRGGELRIYDSLWENGRYLPLPNYRAIVPQQNQVILFPSSLTHEITPVDCPSKAFADSRFTVNGWFHR